MKTTLRALAIVPLAAALGVNAQRYATEVFTDAQLTITPDVPFGQNVDFLTSDLSNPAVFVPEVQMLQGMADSEERIARSRERERQYQMLVRTGKVADYLP